jgi:hypothetical protein
MQERPILKPDWLPNNDQVTSLDEDQIASFFSHLCLYLTKQLIVVHYLIGDSQDTIPVLHILRVFLLLSIIKDITGKFFIGYVINNFS